MKKILTLGVVLALSTTISFAAGEYTKAFKDAVKKDIAATKQEAKNYNASIKESIKKDIEAKQKAQEESKLNTIKQKKAERLKEINSKIADLNKQKATIQSSKDMTYTEKTIKIKAINRQLEYLNKQKDALK